jgi:hypothetical protein
MKRILLVALLSAGAAFAQSAAQKVTVQKWTAGWDIFTEPLNYKSSHVSWSLNPTTNKLSVNFTLEGATPNKLYQVGVHIFCTTFPPTFGQFPTDGITGGTCEPITRQGVTESVTAVEMGVVTTDINGDGSFAVIVGPIAEGTYDIEFDARDGAGCNLIGGGGPCELDFQSPGPIFGDRTTIIVP